MTVYLNKIIYIYIYTHYDCINNNAKYKSISILNKIIYI